jgi:hypothetical protein
MSRNAVHRLASCEQFPEAALRPPRRGKLAHYEEHLKRRWQEGCYNATRLHAEIVTLGFSGSVNLVQRFVQRCCDNPHNHLNGRCPAPVLLSPRQAAWMLTNPQHPRVTEEQRTYLERLTEQCPVIASDQQLAHEFCRLVRERNASGFGDWLEKVAKSDVAELKGSHAG